MKRRVQTTLVACLLAAAVLSGCSESPQDRYSDAVSSLKSARQNLKDAQNHVSNTRNQMQQAQQAYQQAEQKLASRQDDLHSAQSKVQKAATDPVLFRVLQQNVLTKKNFSNSAISVNVTQQVVTLSGTVPDKQTEQKAVRMTQNQPGVAHVIDKLQIGQLNNGSPNTSGGNGS